MGHLITIGRQFGSGGAEIGKILAEKLGIKFYDKELLLEAARKSGIFEGVAEQYDEDGQQSFFYSLVAKGQVGNIANQPINAKLHNEQFQIIRNIADTDGSGVFVGRCADYILEGREGLVDVYISADLDYRINRIAQKYDMKEVEALKLIQRRDSQRSAYYNYYTNKKWSDISSYDLSVNVADLGIEGTVDLILKFIELKEAKK